MTKKIKKEIKETITHVTPTVETCTCDVCNKRIYKKSLVDNSCNNESVVYWRVRTQHNDWGNDSCDSIEYFDICSPECASSKFIDYLTECKSSYTQEFNIEEAHVYGTTKDLDESGIEVEDE